MGFFDYLTAGLGFLETDKKSTRQIKSAIDYQFNDKKIAILHPITFADIVRFVETLGKNTPLIVNFCSLEKENATRGLDFVCGAVCALGGKLERIGDGIYFYAPRSVRVETDNKHKGKSYAH